MYMSNRENNPNGAETMTKTTASIHTAPNGRHYVTDDSVDYLYESGPGHATKAGALRSAASSGYTHYTDRTFGGKATGVRIPARYRNTRQDIFVDAYGDWKDPREGY